MSEVINWRTRAGQECSAALLTSAFSPRVPARIEAVDDTLSADLAYRKACEGTALIWEGDFQNARQLLSALARRLDTRKQDKKAARAAKRGEPAKNAAVPDATKFHAYRMSQANRARVLGMIWIVLDADYRIDLGRAPDVAQACEQAFGQAPGRAVISLRELLGVVGAAQWRVRGVPVPVLGEDALIYPYYGVFSPVRGEYLDLVNTTALKKVDVAWDVGTGTGVLAAILARRGVTRVVATETSPEALACARYNIGKLGLSNRVEVIEHDLFPEGRADLIVCNPPWLPARPTSAIELAIYDPEAGMLTSFIEGLAARLNAGGEGWLIMSDLAQRLGLREPDALLQLFERSGLRVVQQLTRTPTHRKAIEGDDALSEARKGEITSLWRLQAL